MQCQLVDSGFMALQRLIHFLFQKNAQLLCYVLQSIVLVRLKSVKLVAQKSQCILQVVRRDGVLPRVLSDLLEVLRVLVYSLHHSLQDGANLQQLGSDCRFEVDERDVLLFLEVKVSLARLIVMVLNLDESL